MAKPDPLRVVEAGYSFVEDEAEWLRGVLDAARPFDVGTGAAAYTVDLADDGKRIRTFVGDGPFEEKVRSFTSALSERAAREMYAPTEFAGNAVHRSRRIGRDLGEELPRIDTWALVSGDPRARALTLLWPGPDGFTPEQPFPNGRLLGLVAAHLGAAMRLRAAAAPLSRDDRSTEAVVDPDGRVLHAIGPARGARASLVEAVREREKARGKLRRVAPDEAAERWSVLVEGRWSIVDVVERDGKRYLLARKNPVEGPDLLALTGEERDVMWLSTLGHSHKYVAYELGMSLPVVTRRFAAAMKKLRIASRRELLRKLGGLQQG